MTEQLKLGTIQMIDRDNRFGIITEEPEGMSKYSYASESVTFDIDDSTPELREGQLVQFLKVDDELGPRATRIAVLTQK
jgi:cold shock CspA family protein